MHYQQKAPNYMLLQYTNDGKRIALNSPITMPKASSFLWTPKMMLQVNCRGFATGQYMQPEPAKYAHGPTLEAKTFMQPEQPHYAHHPGRFFYVKDHDNNALFSLPYEPVRAPLEKFTFSAGLSDITWHIEQHCLAFTLTVRLASDHTVELWNLQISNLSNSKRNISVYPYFPIGYMSWMNQSAHYDESLCAVVAKSVTPYQMLPDYYKQRDFKDLTFFMAERAPVAVECNRERFEGEGGLHAPSALIGPKLAYGDAFYETPIAAMQYDVMLEANQSEVFRFIFGPAYNKDEIALIKQELLCEQAFEQQSQQQSDYVSQGLNAFSLETPDQNFNDFVNHWLPRQVFYHGDTNRLTTDPQTRNFLQDHMGMAFSNPDYLREAILRTLSQQEPNGAIPDGIKLEGCEELKYINQIPHSDHCIWLPLVLEVYLAESNDYAILDLLLDDEHGEALTVFDRIEKAIQYLLSQRDERGLCLIEQGDWCDPMNMVGHKGIGVSAWLTTACSYALQVWATICSEHFRALECEAAQTNADELNQAINSYFWDGKWYIRGISDDGIRFGCKDDEEGRIYLNPQSWAMLCGACDSSQQATLIDAVEQQLCTPYGPMMLAPAYTGMQEHIGRLTQKHPGSAENGSVYNHAAMFYVFALYQKGESDKAFTQLQSLLIGNNTAKAIQTGQLPAFLPNYYRGAYYQLPDTAGRSSQLFNTGTAAWFYRIIIEELCGLKGTKQGLLINPKLPNEWNRITVNRRFRSALFRVEICRESVSNMNIVVNGDKLDGNIIKNIVPREHYTVVVNIPFTQADE